MTDPTMYLLYPQLKQIEREMQSEPPVRSSELSSELVRATWEYSHYRASLRRNGKHFAIVTPDGKNALTPFDAFVLLKALNGGSNGEVRQSGPDDSK